MFWFWFVFGIMFLAALVWLAFAGSARAVRAGRRDIGNGGVV